ncbi:sperm acrosome membrane-associated protein 6 isoform X3 [Pseudochaenichthys georgianus]|uniref:sperm acrosome membrane-associated protein 6 isoform X3 n=1 Tax=Pseudochaenichthys georgianus TaxID=52239 RepID=UPI00146E992A|nr:sperm acrosome membrane-associated protein 6 isoform X3 [Pseudochaenichthys georgianus]
MCKSALCLVCVSLLLGPSLSCYQCFVEVQDSLRLCWGHILTEHNVRNVDSCFRKLDRIFNNHERVIEAGRVGKGYDKQLKELLDGEILPMVEEFDRKRNNDTVYEERLQTAADNFIAAASKLPRVSGCLPPCGFQSAGAVYNCITCQYDSCELPLDCPVKEVTAMENSRSQMWCEVPFHLPGNIEVIWRFAEEVKTQQVDQFKEVTAGLDTIYSIPSSSLQHVGTYQCEIYSVQRSIVRLYFYLTGCGRPHRAAGDIRPVSAPRRAVSPCACWSPPLPHHLATASHRLFDGFASAAVPLHGSSVLVSITRANKSC